MQTRMMIYDGTMCAYDASAQPGPMSIGLDAGSGEPVQTTGWLADDGTLFVPMDCQSPIDRDCPEQTAWFRAADGRYAIWLPGHGPTVIE